MIIDVSKNKLSLIEGNLIHTGEYKVNEIVFNLSEEYTETTNKAIFTNCSGSYEVPIIDGKCDIPPGVLNEEEIITIGVYGYTIQNNRYVVRYSPAPINVKINEGSYVVGADNGEIITPTQFEIYTQAMNDGLKEVEGTIAYLQEVAEEVNSKGNEAEEKGLFAQQTAEEIQKKANEGDFAGATFIPQVDEEGNISWENDRGLENPEPRNIRGVDGKEGQPGKNATINGLEAINIVGGDNIDLVQQGNDLYINYNGTQMNIEIVENLPTAGVSGRIYLVLKETGADSDIYDEYLYINDVWEHIGSTAIDLSNYYTKEEIDEKIDNIEVPIPTASSDVLGGIKVGENLSIDEDGKLSSHNDKILPVYENKTDDYMYLSDLPDGVMLIQGKWKNNPLTTFATSQYDTELTLIMKYNNNGFMLRKDSDGRLATNKMTQVSSNYTSAGTSHTYWLYTPVNNLTTTSSGKPLDANQGRILNEKIIALEESMGDISTILATLTTVEEVSE